MCGIIKVIQCSSPTGVAHKSAPKQQEPCAVEARRSLHGPDRGVAGYALPSDVQLAANGATPADSCLVSPFIAALPRSAVIRFPRYFDL